MHTLSHCVQLTATFLLLFKYKKIITPFLVSANKEVIFMYFKNDLGTVKIEGNKVITETRFSKTTTEVKAIKYVKRYYDLEVDILKNCLKVK